MKTIWINAGHHLKDRGTSNGEHVENEMAIILRDKIVSLLTGEYQVRIVPDYLNLKQSINWVNERVHKDDLAFSIHFNSHSASYVKGTEAYYSNPREKEWAIIFAEEVARAVGFRNRGARHDSETWVGSLGWLRNLNCDSVLVEMCYLTSKEDMELYNVDKAALGLKQAITKILPEQSLIPTAEEFKRLEKELNESRSLVEQLLHFISKQLTQILKKYEHNQ